MYQIVGKKRVDFTPQDSDKSIQGYSCYVVYPVEDYEGYAADRIFISDYVIKKYGYTPAVGDTVELYYDKNQKIACLRKVDKK